jgi:hypothetical protein
LRISSKTDCSIDQRLSLSRTIWSGPHPQRRRSSRSETTVVSLLLYHASQCGVGCDCLAAISSAETMPGARSRRAPVTKIASSRTAFRGMHVSPQDKKRGCRKVRYPPGLVAILHPCTCKRQELSRLHVGSKPCHQPVRFPRGVPRQVHRDYIPLTGAQTLSRLRDRKSRRGVPLPSIDSPSPVRGETASALREVFPNGCYSHVHSFFQVFCRCLSPSSHTT